MRGTVFFTSIFFFAYKKLKKMYIILALCFIPTTPWGKLGGERVMAKGELHGWVGLWTWASPICSTPPIKRTGTCGHPNVAELQLPTSVTIGHRWLAEADGSCKCRYFYRLTGSPPLHKRIGCYYLPRISKFFPQASYLNMQQGTNISLCDF